MTSEPEGSAAEKGGQAVRMRSSRDGAATVWVDCGTAATARLVREIDSHGGLASVVEDDGTGSGDAPPSPAWVEFRQPVGEPLDRLVDRLGSPPPAVLGKAWKRQLAELRSHLHAARLPLHHGFPEDLRIDKAARLHVAFLPLRIAASICQAEPRCLEQGSLALWLRAERPLKLVGVDRLADAVTAMAAPEGDSPAVQPSAAVALSLSRRSHRTAERAGPVSRRGGGGGMRRRPRRSPMWLWAGGLAALTLIITIAFWWSQGDASATGEKGSRDASPSAGRGAAQAPARRGSPTGETAAASGTSLSELSNIKTLDGEVTAESVANDWEAELTAVDFDAFAEPAVDLAGEGLEATGERAAERGRAEEDVALRDAAAAEREAVSEAAERIAVDLPARDETDPMLLPMPPGIGPREWAAAELETPSGEMPWEWLGREATGENAEGSGRAEGFGGAEGLADAGADPNSLRRSIGMRGADGSRHAVAVLSISGSGSASLAWTATAAGTPAADQLRNARLRVGGRSVYLRTPTESAGVRLEFNQSRQENRWVLATPADPQRSRTSISAANRPAPEGAERLFIQWLQAARADPSRSVRALAEIRPEEDSPVAVRVRFDVKRGRRIELDTLAVATIDPSAGWQPAIRDGVTTAQDRVDSQRLDIQRMLEAIRQQYSIAEKRQLKRTLRQRREALEHQQELMGQWTQRLAELQVLLARIASEVEWQIEVHTEWPDATQTIFASGTNA